MSTQSNKSSKKRKFEENSKLCNEFRGIGSLNAQIINEAKISKLEAVDNNIKEAIELPKVTRLPRKTYILLENIDASVTGDSLMNYLKENNIHCDKLCMVPGPLAFTFFQREKDVDRLFNICQGLHYKSNELLIVKGTIKQNDDESNTSNLSDVSVHIKNLDVNTTEDDLSALIVDISKVKNISIDISKHTAIIDFLDSLSALEFITKFDNYKLRDNIISASFLVKTQRPDQFMLKISNLPHGFNKVDIREAFPQAWKIKIIKGLNHYCQLHFKTLEDYESVVNCVDEVLVKGSPVKIEQLIKTKKSEKKANYVLNIFNMPFDTTLQEIKELYPNVRFIEMLKNSEGMFIGSARCNFDEKEACEDALKNTKGKAIRHRKVRAEMKFENTPGDEGAKVLTDE